MHISTLAAVPDLAVQLVSGLLEHWRYVHPHHTASDRIEKFRRHENIHVLPMAWMAHEGDVALGTAALRVHDLEGREDLSPWLGGVYVRPVVRRRGIASKLCEVVEGKAWELGYKRLFLFTHGQESFYARRGWELLGSHDWHGHQGTIMAKALRGAVES